MSQKLDFTEVDTQVGKAVSLLFEMGLNKEGAALRSLRHVIVYRTYEGSIPNFNKEEEDLDYVENLNNVLHYVDENT